ncbi:unnamed protein product [Meganyctiphanes norvegica]|uniref:C2 domain-containing protein n=1 Tax=Meganyctiphanes norvegica TaxID=48144 RepID=A0AAV2QRG5_MEGNR
MAEALKPDITTLTLTSPQKRSSIPPKKPPRLSMTPDEICSGTNAIKISESDRLTRFQRNIQGTDINVKDGENHEDSKQCKSIYSDRSISMNESEFRNMRTTQEDDEETHYSNNHKTPERKASLGSMLLFASPGLTCSQSSKYSPSSAIVIPTGSSQSSHTEDSKTTGTEMELSIAAQNLSNGIMKGRVSPRCIIYLKDDADGDFQEVGQTEILKNQSNPLWIKKVILSHQVNLVQSLRLSLYNWNLEHKTIEKQELLGHIYTSLDLLVNLDGRQLCLPLKNGKSMVLVNCDPVSNSKEEITLEFGGEALANLDVFSKSDPFLIIYRRSNGCTDTFVPVHRTETIMDNLNPVWKPFSIPGGLLSGGDHYRMIKIECWDWDTDGNHDHIGECYTTLSRLLSGPSSDNVYDLKKPKYDKEHSSSKTGKLVLKSISSTWESSFQEHINRGTSLQWTVAIDFSAQTGGEPLHAAREFMYALGDLKTVVKQFQKDETAISAFGFLGGNKGIFPLRKETQDLDFRNVDDICEAYQQVLEKGVSEGSTSDIAAPLKYIFPSIQGHQDGSNYHVLIILTGPGYRETSEMSQLLLEASVLPISIVIIGVGDGIFSDLKKFENNTSYGQGSSMRSNLTFLGRSDLLNKSGLSQWSSEFSREILKHLPQQLVTWKRMKGLKPGLFRKNSGI